MKNKPNRLWKSLFFVVIALVVACKSDDPAASPTATRAITAPTGAVSPTQSVTPSATTVVTSTPYLPVVTAVPTTTPIPLPTSTPVPTPTPVLLAWSENQIIGYSVLDRPIEVVRLGNGPRWFVVLAAIHGGHECNTNDLAARLLNRLIEEPALLPPDVTLYVMPLANPDGCVANTRENANGVDLNRNWDTDDWTADAENSGGALVGSGGPYPFSEPETSALRDWLLALQTQHEGPISVISYHSRVPVTGLAQPGYTEVGQPGPRSEQLAQIYAQATGYRYSPTWVGAYTITGEFIHWAAANNIISADVELPDWGLADTTPPGWTETHLDTNLRGLLAILATSNNE